MRIKSLKTKLALVFAIGSACIGSFQSHGHGHGSATSFANPYLTAGVKKSHGPAATRRHLHGLQAAKKTVATSKPMEEEHKSLVDKLSTVFASSSLEVATLRTSLQDKNKFIEQMRNEHNENITQLNDRMQEMNLAHEKKMFELRSNYEKQLQDKDEHIKNLVSEIQETKASGQERLIHSLSQKLTDALQATMASVEEDARKDRIAASLKLAATNKDAVKMKYLLAEGRVAGLDPRHLAIAKAELWRVEWLPRTNPADDMKEHQAKQLIQIISEAIREAEADDVAEHLNAERQGLQALLAKAETMYSDMVRRRKLKDRSRG
mmetsp:Transcript_98856/g.176097  ORF Transcript_98856/g.176097 Transcript_98856/m.176097 type:complete len:321 (-) Transcript_98856:203-1165(-)